MHPSRTPKFKVLVGHNDGTDPSRFGGNGQATRSVFELQTVTGANGVSRVGGPTVAPLAVSSSHYTAAVRVLSNTYWNPDADPPPPFFPQEEVMVGSTFLTSGEEFGIEMGGGADTAAHIATSLALAIQTVEGITAVASGDTVYILSHRTDGYLPIKASNDTSVIFSGYTFQVKGPSGEVLTTAPRDRRTFFVMKLEKSQSPPVIR